MRQIVYVVCMLLTIDVANAQDRNNEACAATDALTACVTLRRAADVVISVSADDEWDSRLSASVSAKVVVVDGEPGEQLLLFPGTGRRTYSAVVGPLAAGSHTIALARSDLWPSPSP